MLSSKESADLAEEEETRRLLEEEVEAPVGRGWLPFLWLLLLLPPASCVGCKVVRTRWGGGREGGRSRGRGWVVEEGKRKRARGREGGQKKNAYHDVLVCSQDWWRAFE